MTNIEAGDEKKRWFAMRVTYQRELIAKEKLDSLGIKNFVPTLRIKKTDNNGKVVWKKVSALHNYIFIHSTREEVDDIKKYKIPWLRYIMSHSCRDSKEPLSVPDKEMLNFMAVAGKEEEKIIFLGENEINLTAGDKVRILSGPFEGVEGIFVRLKEKGSGRVVVRIEGVAAVATTAIASRLVEKI